MIGGVGTIAWNVVLHLVWGGVGFRRKAVSSVLGNLSCKDVVDEKMPCK